MPNPLSGIPTHFGRSGDRAPLALASAGGGGGGAFYRPAGRGGRRTAGKEPRSAAAGLRRSLTRSGRSRARRGSLIGRSLARCGPQAPCLPGQLAAESPAPAERSADKAGRAPGRGASAGGTQQRTNPSPGRGLFSEGPPRPPGPLPRPPPGRALKRQSQALRSSSGLRAGQPGGERSALDQPFCAAGSARMCPVL